MSPPHPYPHRPPFSSLESLDSESHESVNNKFEAYNGDTSASNMWWPSTHFNLRPALSEKVSEFVRRNANPSALGVQEDRNSIRDALEFSRRMGVYYNIAWLLFPIGVFVVRKAAGKLKRWKKAQKHKNRHHDRNSTGTNSNTCKKGNVEISIVETASTASSSSSANEVATGEIETDETKPLLHGSSSKLSWYTLLYRRIKGYLTFQRPPDPRGRVMPHNTIIICNMLFFLSTIFLSIYNIYLPGDPGNNGNRRFFLMADRWGIIFAMNQPLNFMLAAKTSPIKYLTGWSYEQHLIFHRIVAQLSHVASIFHFAGMYVVFRMFFAGTGHTFLSIISRRDVLMGLLSFIAFWIFGFTSVDEFRAKSYEVFLATHIIFSAAAMGFLYFHHPTTRVYVVWSLVIWATDRIAYRAFHKRRHADAVVKVLDESTIRVTLKNVGGEGGKWRWEPAGHLFLTVPGWTRLQAHPFTILSAPPGYDLDENSVVGGEKEIVLVIRKLKGFTDALYGMGDEQGRVDVTVDGPYGSEHARHLFKEVKKSILIAGGSGIAVAWPLVCEVIRRRMDKVKKGETGKGRRIVLVWVVQYEHHLKWLEEDLEQLEDVKRRILPRDFEIEIRTFVTRGANGKRPDLRKEITRVVEDEEGINERLEGQTGILVCGPDPMVREVRTVARDLLYEGKDLEVLAEKFGW